MRLRDRRRLRTSLVGYSLTWVLVALFCKVAFAQPIPAGEDFQVNTYTTDAQFLPSVGSLCDRFVVVWSSVGSFGSDTSSLSIQGKIVDASGNDVSAEFQVNTYTTDYATQPDISRLSCSTFVVVWASNGSYGSDDSLASVLGQRFRADGSTLGPEFQVNTYTTQAQKYPDVAAEADGRFLVVWESRGSNGTDTSITSIQGRLYAPDGAPLSGEFQVNTYTTGRQQIPAVASAPGKGFFVVWTGRDVSFSGIKGRRFDATGTPTSPEFQINTYTFGFQSWGEVSMGSDGDAMVVWTRGGEIPGDPTSLTVRAQRFDSAGNFSGSEFLISTNTTVLNAFADVAAIGRDEFFFVWQAVDIVTGNNDIAGQFYSGGTLLPKDFLVSSYTTKAQVGPRIHSLPTGDFLTTWASEASPGNDNFFDSIVARLFRVPVQARAIPALGGVGLAVLSVLLSFLGLRYLRAR